MKTTQLIFISIFFFNFYIFPQDWLNDKEDLKGNVKSVYYEKLTIVGEDENNWWNEKIEKQYNDKGYLIKSDLQRTMHGNYQYGIFRKFNEEGTQCMIEYEIINSDTNHVSYFIYDSLNRVEKKIHYCYGEQCSTSYFYYNENNQVSECYTLMLYDKDTNRIIYEYDDFGLKIRESDISSSCVIIKTWEYDQRGNITLEKSELQKSPGTTVIRVNSDGTREIESIDNFPDDDRNYVITYEYNENNQLIHEIRKYLDDRIRYDVSYNYNEKGLIASESYLTSECCEDGNATFQYRSDDHDNWVLISKKGHKILSEVEKRVIEYY